MKYSCQKLINRFEGSLDLFILRHRVELGLLQSKAKCSFLFLPRRTQILLAKVGMRERELREQVIRDNFCNSSSLADSQCGLLVVTEV